MTERVEEIRRAVERAKVSHYGIEPDDAAFLLTALAQAERTIKELEHLKNDAILRFDEIDRENESLHEQIAQAERERGGLQDFAASQSREIVKLVEERDAARAEMERLKEELDQTLELARKLNRTAVGDMRRAEQAEAALAQAKLEREEINERMTQAEASWRALDSAAARQEKRLTGERDAARAEVERLKKSLDHWKDCHGVTAETLVKVEADLARVRGALDIAEQSLRWINWHSHGEVAGEAMNARERVRAALEGR